MALRHSAVRADCVLGHKTIMTMCAGSCPDQPVRGWPHIVAADPALRSRISIAVVLIEDEAPPKRRSTPMTAFAGPRLATRPARTRIARPSAVAHARESFSALRGAVRAVT